MSLSESGEGAAHEQFSERTEGDADIRSIRERLMEAGMREFARYGFRGSSLRRITDAVGVSVGNVGHVFGSKREFFEDVLRSLMEPVARCHEEQLDRLETATHEPDLVEVFDARVKGLVELLSHEEGALRGLFLWHSVTEHDVFWPVVKEMSQRADPRFTPLARRALGHLSADEADYRWAQAVRTFFVTLTPSTQNVDEPEVVSAEGIDRVRRLCIQMLSAPSGSELELPPPPWAG